MTGWIAASVVGACVGALSLASVPALAEDEPYRVRGTLTGVEGDQLTLTNSHGEVLGFRLTEESGIFVVTPASLDDVKEGRFVGLTSIEASGRRIALEAHLFSEDLRGVGEGHYAWDLIDEPNMMTNANIAEVKEVGDDRELTVTYAEGEGETKTEGTQVIFVAPDAPIVELAETDDRELLAVDKQVLLIVRHAGDGSPTVDAAVVGDGIDPPM